MPLYMAVYLSFICFSMSLSRDSRMLVDQWRRGQQEQRSTDCYWEAKICLFKSNIAYLFAYWISAVAYQVL